MDEEVIHLRRNKSFFQVNRINFYMNFFQRRMNVMRQNYRRWSEHPYPGQPFPYQHSSDVGSWPMFFITRGPNNEFFDPFGQNIHWQITHPNHINWEAQLAYLEQTLRNLTPEQVQMARYWGTGELTAKITADIYKLARVYRLGSPELTQVLAYVNAALNDVFIITWFLKYQWDVARPNQYGRNLNTVVSTPLFPSYPSAHATVAGCSEVILSYFFPPQSSLIKQRLEQSALSRLYAGVHFKVDNDEGLRLGRQIGTIVVQVLRSQKISGHYFTNNS
jgi:hypothetical protein